jgi:hypothetical protein
MILVFDLGGPLLAYGLLRSAGTSAVTALVISGVLPALGIVIGAVTDRRLDVIGVVVLAGLLVGTLLGLTSHNAGSTCSRARCPRPCSRWTACSRCGCGGR